MKPPPHVERVSDDTIQRTIDLPNTVLLLTPRAEALEKWIPDVGQ